MAVASMSDVAPSTGRTIDSISSRTERMDTMKGSKWAFRHMDMDMDMGMDIGLNV